MSFKGRVGSGIDAPWREFSSYQYISDYHKIVMKLKGIYEFQIFWGFMWGLNPNYEVYMEPKQPKDLVEALKYA